MNGLTTTAIPGIGVALVLADRAKAADLPAATDKAPPTIVSPP